jgi:hypothetical protein
MIHPALDGTVAASMVAVNMPNGLCTLAYVGRCIFFDIRRYKELILEKAAAHESDLAGLMFGEHQLANRFKCTPWLAPLPVGGLLSSCSGLIVS